MPNCVVKGCSNNSSKNKKQDGITFHTVKIMRYLILSTMLFMLPPTTKQEVFYTALAHFDNLRVTHKSIVDSLGRYLHEEMQRINNLKKYLDSFTREKGTMNKDADYVKNPVNAYKLINRLTKGWETVQNYTKEKTEYKRPPDLVFPQLADLEGAAAGVWRLQRTYSLNIGHLAAGLIRGNFSEDRHIFEERTIPMSAMECYEVGRVAFYMQDYESAAEWMQVSLRMLQSRGPGATPLVDPAHVMEYIEKAYLKLDDAMSAIEWTVKLTELRHGKETHHSKYILKDIIYKRQKPPPNDITKLYSAFEYFHMNAPTTYRALCRGEIEISERIKKSLRCYYKSSPLFLRLARVRSEELHRDPDVILFHDVISDRESEHVQYLATSKQSTVGDEPENSSISYRSSKSAWLSDEESNIVAKITKRIQDLTGLSSAVAEHLHVINYGIGGHYDPHFDVNVIEHRDDDFNRIATVLLYMSNVEQGGATIFMGMNVTVFPVKNAALFWHNLLPSGQPDYRTLHAACPVLYGSKWVANKWLLFGGQEFLKPCSLEYQENKHIFEHFQNAHIP